MSARTMTDVSTLVLKDIHRTFIQGENELKVLQGANLSIEKGEIVALTGPSGAGKSTLLHIAGLLESANSGTVAIMGSLAGDLSDAERTEIRRNTLGFVYQFHHLLPEFTALENVILPQMISGGTKVDAARKARLLLSRLGLAARLEHRPSELSGGEQQRVAIARAMANDPALLLADEPTGNLDQKTSSQVFDELVTLVKERGLSALIATHNIELAGKMDREVAIIDGKLIGV